MHVCQEPWPTMQEQLKVKRQEDNSRARVARWMNLCENVLIHDTIEPRMQEKLRARRKEESDKGKILPWDKVESYMWELMKIPACKQRLDCWAFMSKLPNEVRGYEIKLQLFEH